MTIFFSNHKFNYELEGVCKLFLPVERFKQEFGAVCLPQDDDYIITRLKRLKTETLLWVRASVGEKTAHGVCKIANDADNYTAECERLLSALLYRCLQTLTKITPKWGILTGVRPVNMLWRLRREGKTQEEIERYFKTERLVSDGKLRLAQLTADAQAEILEKFDKKSYSLYVAIPFCASRCSYCSFVSQSIDSPKAAEGINEYVTLLCRELEKTAEIARICGLKLDTVYIGGGTPTAISAYELKRVTDAIARYFPISEVGEYTIEAGRADTITREKLEVIKNSGANRISVNPQTFNDEVLRVIGRKHTAQQAIDCFHTAREFGFDAINMDFIAGLPSDTPESFKATIDKAVELNPENITVHTLSIKRSAKLFEDDKMAKYAQSNITAFMTDYAAEKLVAAGYTPYYLYRQKNMVGNLENVGYAKKGSENRYNIYIMEEMQTILSCGAGGVTKLVTEGENPISRIFNFKYHYEYIDRFDEILSRKEAIIPWLTAQEPNTP